MKKVLLISPDTINKKMAGPAIRYLNIAKELSKYLEVTLYIPNIESDMDFSSYSFVVIKGDNSRMMKAAKSVDSIVIQGIALRLYPFLKKLKKPIVVDLYDPITLENLELRKALSLKDRIDYHETDLDIILEQLARGDYFICASDKQKDYWLGMLSAINRVNPATYNDDNSMNGLIGVVPFGLSSEMPKKTKASLKGVWPGINRDDKVIIWGGGIWNWFDPISLIEAMHIINKKRKDIKLFFMGIGHPTANIDISMAEKCIALSKKYNLYNRAVFFNDWVPYEERQNYLLEADIGISTYFNNIETRFSFRTRILDYLWCDLPMVLTEGDYMADMVHREKLGLCHEQKDTEGLAESILRLIEDEDYYLECKANIEGIKADYSWNNAIKPLLDFCSSPKVASDKELKVNIHYKKTVKSIFKYFFVRVKNRIKRLMGI